jgi:hypothetical protein
MYDNSSRRPTDDAPPTIHLLKRNHHPKEVLPENTRSVELVTLEHARIEKMVFACVEHGVNLKRDGLD